MRAGARANVVIAILFCWSAAWATQEPALRVTMGGIKQTRYDRNGKVAAVIEAEQASLDDRGTLIMEHVKAVLSTGDGKQLEITASKGKADTGGTKDALFEDGLKLVFSGFVVTTSRATWCESDKTVRGSDKIVLEKEDSRIVGSGFVVFTGTDEAIVYRPRGTFRLDRLKTKAE